MASGLATVSFDYAAAALHVRSGENGLKAAKGDAVRLHRTGAARARPCATDHDPARIRAGIRANRTRLGPGGRRSSNSGLRISRECGRPHETPRPNKASGRNFPAARCFYQTSTSARRTARRTRWWISSSTSGMRQAGPQRRHHRRLGAPARRTLDLPPQPRDPQGHQDDRARQHRGDLSARQP